jgi:hypothetical protein
MNLDWDERDARVLRWLKENPPEHEFLATNRVSENESDDLAGLTEVEIHVSVETLAEEGLVTFNNQTFESAGGVYWSQFQVSGLGMQALGEWPVFGSLGVPEELGDLLDALAEMAPNDEEESNLKAAADIARKTSSGALRALAAGALGALIRSQIG